MNDLIWWCEWHDEEVDFKNRTRHAFCSYSGVVSRWERVEDNP